MSDELWSPSFDRIENSQLARLIRKHGLQGSGSEYDYDQLWEFSVKNLPEFWDIVWDFCGVIGHKGDEVITPANHLKDVWFFPGSKLNFAENLLKTRGKKAAMISLGEDGSSAALSWDDLRQQVAALQEALESLGVGEGDRVAGIVTNTNQAVLAMLAVTSLGAVWSSCSPDFGINAILDRFRQIKPKVLFGVNGYFYNGKWHSTLSKCEDVADQIASVRRLVVYPYLGTQVGKFRPRSKATTLAEFTSNCKRVEPEFTRVGFRDPLVIMFSSGTTGLPKCIVHSVGGVLLKHQKEHRLQCDIHDGDHVFYFTTCGWMMWNWKVSALACNATITLYDGSPMYPGLDRLPRLVETAGITHFGASAKYFDSCAKQKIKPRSNIDLQSLRAIFSTGSPLSPESFDYIYTDWKDDVCLSSIAGGTDILGCFVGGSPISPVYRGQCQKRLLGMDVQVLDEEGNAVHDEAGELVCASPHPTIPIGFYDDPEDKRFNAAYFEKYPGVWHHGDWVSLTPQGGMVFHGRSDATLNPGGVRIGTAEIYRPVEQIPEVEEALVIGREVGEDTELVLFVKLIEGETLTETLVNEIRGTVRMNASPRHVPAKVIAVHDIPRTKSGKIVEMAVRDIIHGRGVKNTHALANPEALEQFKNHPELSS